MSTNADLIVVGGGPVGLATAIEARLAGLEVTVVEPRDSPIDKACGEGLMPGAVSALRRLGVTADGYDLAGIAYVDGDTRAEHRFRTGQGRGVRRTVLQPALAARAEELGARRIVGKVTDLRQDAAGVRVALGGSRPILAPWLVACDGLHSTMRRLTGLERVQGSRAWGRFGLNRHFALAPWSEFVEVHWTPTAEIYVTPLGPELLGVAVLGSRGLDFARVIEQSPEVAARLNGAAAVSATRGAGPLLQRTQRRSAGHVLLAGDASGYVDALTGEGLRVGFAQARAAVSAVVTDDAAGYERAWARSTRDFRMLTSGLLAVSRSPLRSRIVPSAVRSPRLFGTVVERLAR